MKPGHLALGVLVTVIWGSNFSVIEAGLRDLDPFLLTALRFTFTAFPLVLFVRRPRQVPIAALAGYGVLFGVGLWWVVNLAMSRGMSPGLSSLLLQSSAFFTVLLSALLLRERVRMPQVWGMSLALCGMALVIGHAPSSSTLVGVALVMLAAISWSACNVIVKMHRPEDMLAFVVWSSVFSAPALFVLAWVHGGVEPFVALTEGLTWRAAGSIAFQAYVTTVFGYLVWNNLMKTYPAASVAPLSLLVPVSGIVTSWIVFDEHFAPQVWAGMAIILAGIALFVASPWLRPDDEAVA